MRIYSHRTIFLPFLVGLISSTASAQLPHRFEAGDVITALESEGQRTEVKKTVDFIKVLGKLKPGAQLTLIGKRGAQEITVGVTLGEWPKLNRR